MQLPSFTRTPREIEAGKWCWDGKRGQGQAALLFWAVALMVGAGVAQGSALLPNLCSSPPPQRSPAARGCPRLILLRPLILSFAFLPLSLCVSSLALRSLPPFSFLCGYLCLSLHLRFHFFLCLCLSLDFSVPRSLLRSLLASCSFSLPLFVWLSSLPLFSRPPPPPIPHTSQPVYDIPRAGRWAGLQQRRGEGRRRSLPPSC